MDRESTHKDFPLTEPKSTIPHIPLFPFEKLDFNPHYYYLITCVMCSPSGYIFMSGVIAENRGGGAPEWSRWPDGWSWSIHISHQLFLILSFSLFLISSLLLVLAASVMNPNPSKGYDRCFCIRMKSTLTKRGVHVKSSGYRVRIGNVGLYTVYGIGVLGG